MNKIQLQLVKTINQLKQAKAALKTAEDAIQSTGLLLEAVRKIKAEGKALSSPIVSSTERWEEEWRKASADSLMLTQLVALLTVGLEEMKAANPNDVLILRLADAADSEYLRIDG